jgi:hypothetical protein
MNTGLLLLLAAIGRGRGESVLATCDALCALRSKLLAPGRIGITLWLLGQLAAAGPHGQAMALHVWCRLVLPGIVLTPVAVGVVAGKAGKKKGKCEKICQMEPPARAAAVAFAQALLSNRAAFRSAARTGVPAGPSRSVTAAVPPAAVAAVAAAVASSTVRGVSRDAAADAASLHAGLADVHLQCGAPEALTAAFAAVLAAADSGDATAAATSAATLLERHGGAAAAAWGRVHKNALAGSTILVEHIAAHRASLLALAATPDGGDTLSTLLWTLTKANTPLLTRDGAISAVASRAQTAIDALGSSILSSTGSSGVLSLFAIATLTMAAAVYAANRPEAATGAISPLLGAQAAALVVSVAHTAVARVTGTAEWLLDVVLGNL